MSSNQPGFLWVRRAIQKARATLTREEINQVAAEERDEVAAELRSVAAEKRDTERAAELSESSKRRN